MENFNSQFIVKSNFFDHPNYDLMVIATRSKADFIPTLVELELLDGEEFNYRIHNWSKYYPSSDLENGEGNG